MKDNKDKEIKKLKTLIDKLENKDETPENNEVINHLKEKLSRLEEEQKYEHNHNNFPWTHVLITSLGVSVFWLIIIVLIQRGRNNHDIL